MTNTLFLILMAMIMAIGPFAIDTYLPALPSMADYFNVGYNSVATTISFYILGMSVGQLIGGPLSDRFGKKKLIIFGLSIFILSAVIISTSDSLHIIQVLRVVQAMGAGFAIVCVPSYIREKATGNEAAKMFALIALLMVAAPAIAPAIGALLLIVTTWEVIFYFLAIYALLIILLTIYKLPDDSVRKVQPLSFIDRYAYVIRKRSALPYILIQSFSHSIMMVFITNASFIYQEHFHLSKLFFTIIFAANIVAMAAVNRINNRLLEKYPARELLNWASKIQLFFVMLFLLSVYMQAPLALLATSIILMVGMLGAITPNCYAVYISYFSENTGSASALIGSAQFFASSVTSGITAILYNGSLWPIAIMIIFLTIISNLLFLIKTNYINESA